MFNKCRKDRRNARELCVWEACSISNAVCSANGNRTTNTEKKKTVGNSRWMMEKKPAVHEPSKHMIGWNLTWEINWLPAILFLFHQNSLSVSLIGCYLFYQCVERFDGYGGWLWEQYVSYMRWWKLGTSLPAAKRHHMRHILWMIYRCATTSVRDILENISKTRQALESKYNIEK